MGSKNWIKLRGTGIRGRFMKMLKCIYSREQIIDDDVPSSESLATRDYSASGYSSRAGEIEPKPDTSNIEEAESSLRESACLNYEEARALLGRLEYQKGNIEAALHVFEGINIAAITPNMKVSIARRCENNKRRRSQSDVVPPMSMHAVCLLFEAIFLKAMSLHTLGKFKEAADSCKIILDTIQSALPEGLPEYITTDNKMREIINKAVELLPELWKLAGFPQETILSYRRALLYHWNLDFEIKTKIEKEFAIFLLYSGSEASPPNLRCQTEGSFVPKNNIEEAILLLLIIVRKFVVRRIEWDPSIIDHLSFALSVSGELRVLAKKVEELVPGVIDRTRRYQTLALCYYGEGEADVALSLLRNLLNNRENQNCIMDLLLASKICGENPDLTEEGTNYAYELLSKMDKRCTQIESVANCVLGILLSSRSEKVSSDSERILGQSKALEALEKAEKIMGERDENVLLHLSLENAEQRKLDSALYYANEFLKVDCGCTVKGWILLARILSAQKRFLDAESVINAALDQTGKWDHGELFRTKAKLQIAQGQLRNAVETYTHLLAILQVRNKNFGSAKKVGKSKSDQDRRLEMETWHDLANVYTSLSQWRDAEICLSKSMAIAPHSASRWHSTGLLYEAQGQHREALRSFENALDVKPAHVPSLVSTATLLKQMGNQSLPVVRSFLTDALRLDRTNPCAWYNLGMLYKANVGVSATEAAECFEAAIILEDSAPVEPFR